MGEKRTLICHRCKAELALSRTCFKYLGHSLYAEVFRCPVCGQVFIPEETVRGRMSEVEMMLEDK